MFLHTKLPKRPILVVRVRYHSVNDAIRCNRALPTEFAASASLVGDIHNEAGQVSGAITALPEIHPQLYGWHNYLRKYTKSPVEFFFLLFTFASQSSIDHEDTPRVIDQLSLV